RRRYATSSLYPDVVRLACREFDLDGSGDRLYGVVDRGQRPASECRRQAEGSLVSEQRQRPGLLDVVVLDDSAVVYQYIGQRDLAVWRDWLVSLVEGRGVGVTRGDVHGPVGRKSQEVVALLAAPGGRQRDQVGQHRECTAAGD